MVHDLPAEFLYSAYKIETTFSDGVTRKTVQGTAFIIDIGGGKPAIVTNRHLLELDYKALTDKYKQFGIAEVRMTGRRADDSIYRFRLDPSSMARFPESYLDDVGLFINPSIEILENMSELKLYSHFGLSEVADADFLSSLKPFDVVAFSGFPEEHDQLSERPLLRSGRIASDPRHDFSLRGKAAGQCIAYETFSHGGASGSPVFAPAKGLHGIPGSRHGKLVGINAGHLNFDSGQHAGLSYFYRSTVILSVLNANGVDTKACV